MSSKSKIKRVQTISSLHVTATGRLKHLQVQSLSAFSPQLRNYYSNTANYLKCNPICGIFADSVLLWSLLGPTSVVCPGYTDENACKIGHPCFFFGPPGSYKSSTHDHYFNDICGDMVPKIRKMLKDNSLQCEPLKRNIRRKNMRNMLSDNYISSKQVMEIQQLQTYQRFFFIFRTKKFHPFFFFWIFYSKWTAGCFSISECPTKIIGDRLRRWHESVEDKGGYGIWSFAEISATKVYFFFFFFKKYFVYVFL